MSERTVDGVRVAKSFEAETFPVPAVVFELSAERAARVRIVDEIPDHVAMEHVGFHPEYESDAWTAYQDGRVEFERELEPGETVTTIYGVQVDDPDPSAFLDDPTVDVNLDDAPDVEFEELRDTEESDSATVDTDSVEQLAPSERGDVVRDALAEDEPLPGSEHEAAATEPQTETEPTTGEDTDMTDEPADTTGEESTETEPTADGEAVTGAEPEPAADEESADDAVESSAETTAPAGDGVAAALAEEIRAGEVSEADRETLASELAALPASADARVDRLESEFATLEAYAEALEEFIDENGQAADVLADLETDIETAEDRLAELETDLDAVTETTTALEDTLGDLRRRVDAVEDLETDVEALREDLEAVDERTPDGAELDDEVSALANDLEDLERDIRELHTWREQLSDVFGGGQQQ